MFLQEIQKTIRFSKEQKRCERFWSIFHFNYLVSFHFKLKGDQGKATLEVGSQISRIFNLPKST